MLFRECLITTMKHTIILVAAVVLAACNATTPKTEETAARVQPVYVTEPVQYDTDDPAIWVDKNNPTNTLILGTDKDADGGLYAFDLKGKIIANKVVKPLQRPNNTAMAYGLAVADSTMDIVVVAERLSHKIRVYRLPDMQPVDNGGIDAFVGETGTEFRDLMGIACYTNPENNQVYVIAGRKNGPTDGTYLWQYHLTANDSGTVEASLVRKFGKFSGQKEIEAIAVDNELGYIYYCDENVGVRKYYANPEKGNEELALFGTKDFTEDNEGIAIYETGKGKGYIFISDQQATQLAVFAREGTEGNANEHKLLGYVPYEALETDGIEIYSDSLNSDFPQGILVAMSEGKTFHLYSMKDLLAGMKPS